MVSNFFCITRDCGVLLCMCMVFPNTLFWRSRCYVFISPSHYLHCPMPEIRSGNYLPAKISYLGDKFHYLPSSF